MELYFFNTILCQNEVLTQWKWIMSCLRWNLMFETRYLKTFFFNKGNLNVCSNSEVTAPGQIKKKTHFLTCKQNINIKLRKINPKSFQVQNSCCSSLVVLIIPSVSSCRVRVQTGWSPTRRLWTSCSSRWPWATSSPPPRLDRCPTGSGRPALKLRTSARSSSRYTSTKTFILQ